MRITSVLAPLCLTLCLIALLALPRPAGADVLWDNGDPNMVKGLCCQRVGAVTRCDVADDFHTNEMWVVTGAHWVTLDDTTYDWAGAADWTIYEYTAYGPGDPLVELWEVPNEREYLGEAWGRPVWGYTIDLAALGLEFDLPAGDYFTLLRPYTPGSTGLSFWLTSDPPPGSTSEVYFRCPFFSHYDWIPGHEVFGEYYDVNFKLTGEMFDPGCPDAVIDLPAGDVVMRQGDYVEFAGTATDEDGEIADYLWTFGEGSGIDDMHVEDPGLVQFNNLGVFTVTFNAQDNDGKWDPRPDQRTACVTNTGAICVDKRAPGPEHDGLTWDTAHLTIQEGVNICAPGGEVWVADGTYVENLVMGEGVAIYGGFLGAEADGYEESLGQRNFVRNITTIDGNRSGSCVTMALEARADGFTITNGNGTAYPQGDTRGGGFYCNGLRESGVIANCSITGNSATHGGGVYCVSSSPEVVSNLITENTVDRHGGGICCRFSSSIIADNIITGNRASEQGGGIDLWRSSATIVGNTIDGNSAGDGGGIRCNTYSWPTVIGNTITGNSAAGDGGGVYCRFYSGPTLTNCVITGNSAQGNGGGLCCRDSGLTLANCAIAGNSAAGNGGGVFCDQYCSPMLTNCTITGNSAAWGAALACDSYNQNRPSDVLITNCILWNGGGEVWDNDDSTITITYSDVQGGYPGEGNIDADPVFANPGEGDFHLTAYSLCIDAGTNDAPGLPATDWEGEDRIVNGVVDIGADEYITYYTEAPDPQPECDGPLFGEPQAGYPAWVWFSIPLTPDCPVGSGCADPNALLGFPCNGRLWYWDKYGNWVQVYKPPFVEWELAAGNSFILYLEAPVTNPWYEGLSPYCPWEFEFKLGRQGWTWIGMPGLTELAGDDFMSSVKVKYPSDETGSYRTAQADYDVIPDNWITWGWPYWNTWRQAIETFTPYGPFEHNTCYPWLGYRVWINVGTALDESDPDQVTLIWPRQ